MTKHGLIASGWRFDFDRATSRLGACHHAKKLITLSRHMVGAAELDVVEQTMLHEVAHALLPTHDLYGKRIGHGYQWKSKAASIGYTGKRTTVNPYRTPLKRTAAGAGPRPFVVQRPTNPETRMRMTIGATVRTLDGSVEGVVMKFGTSRAHFLAADGRTYSCPPNGLIVVKAADPEAVAAIRADSAPKFVENDPVRIVGSSKDGLTATIETVNRSRYRIRMDGTGEILLAPFSMVAAA